MIILFILFGCSSSSKSGYDKKFIEDKKSFVSYFSSNVSSHLSTYNELSVIEAVQNLSRFKDIENAWIVGVDNKIIAIMKIKGYKLGAPFKEQWLLSLTGDARKAKGILVVIKKGERGVLYTFVSPLYDRVFKRYLGVAIVQYIKSVKK